MKGKIPIKGNEEDAAGHWPVLPAKCVGQHGHSAKLEGHSICCYRCTQPLENDWPGKFTLCVCSWHISEAELTFLVSW